MTQVWDVPLTCSQKLVLLKLADNAHDDGLSARPGVSTIARQCGLSERCVQYTLREIAATQFSEGGRGLVTEYRLSLEKGATGAGERVQLVRVPKEKGATGSQKGATDDMKPKLLKEVVLMNHQEPYKPFVQPDLNGDPEAAPPIPWPAHLSVIKQMLDELNSPAGFYDIDFWQTIYRSYEPLPDVFYVDELRKYLVWWHQQPPSRRRKVVTRSFATWLRTEEAKAQARATRKETTNGFHPQPLR